MPVSEKFDIDRQYASKQQAYPFLIQASENKKRKKLQKKFFIVILFALALLLLVLLFSFWTKSFNRKQKKRKTARRTNQRHNIKQRRHQNNTNFPICKWPKRILWWYVTKSPAIQEQYSRRTATVFLDRNYTLTCIYLPQNDNNSNNKPQI